MSNNIEELLSRYDGFLDQGTTAYHAGDLPKAREYVLMAAERLFKIANLSQLDLQEVRIKRANELLDEAEAIGVEYEKRQKAVPEAVSGADENDANYALGQRPELRLKDVAGLEQAKSFIRERLIDPFLYPEMTAEFGLRSGGGMLLYGPPGTGKTLMAKAVAGEVDAAFFPVLPSDILEKWVVTRSEIFAHSLMRRQNIHALLSSLMK